MVPIRQPEGPKLRNGGTVPHACDEHVIHANMWDPQCTYEHPYNWSDAVAPTWIAQILTNLGSTKTL